MQAFIAQNIDKDPSALRLKYHGAVADFDIQFAITQIECRQRFGKKLAQTLAEIPHFIFPSVLAGEQATSDRLAEFHASLIEPKCRVLDLTAGLGIDAYHCSKRAAHVTAVDIEEAKVAALKANYPQIEAVEADCREYIAAMAPDSCDVVFIDPARRDAAGGRVYDIADCSPDVVELMPRMLEVAPTVICKLSPMLDITRTLAQLPQCSRIYTVGTRTECRELLAVCNRGFDGTPRITAETIDEPQYSFTRADEESADFVTAMPGAGWYIYEPYAPVMKAGPYALLCKTGAATLDANSHYYVSPSEVDFPGVVRQIVEILPFESKHIKRLSRQYPRISVAARNFPMSADVLRKKLKVAEGPDYHLIATTIVSQPYLIITKNESRHNPASK